MLAGGGIPGPMLDTQSAATAALAAIPTGNWTIVEATRTAAIAKRVTSAGRDALPAGYAPGLR